MNNEEFLKECNKFISENLTIDRIDRFLNLLENFQNERLEKLSKVELVQNSLFAEYLSPSLNEAIGNQSLKQEKILFETVAQNLTQSILIALKEKIKNQFENLFGNQIEQEDFKSITQYSSIEIEKFLNNEKKNTHKLNSIIHDYVQHSQEILYDHEKISLKSVKESTIEDRLKEIQKYQNNKKFNIQELQHPKLDAQKFEREMKLLLSGDISETNINSVLKSIENFQEKFVDLLKNKVLNPTGSHVKLLPNIPEQAQLKSLKEWSWQEESVNVMKKVLKIIEKECLTLNLDNKKSILLFKNSEELESTMLDIGSLKKFNSDVKKSLIENLNNVQKILKSNKEDKNTIKNTI